MRIFYVPTYLHYNLLQQHQAASIRQRLIQNRHGKKASYHNKNANVHRKRRLSATYQCQNNISRLKSLRHSSKKLICPIGAYRKAALNVSFVLHSHCIKKYPCVFQHTGFFGSTNYLRNVNNTASLGNAIAQKIDLQTFYVHRFSSFKNQSSKKKVFNSKSLSAQSVHEGSSGPEQVRITLPQSPAFLKVSSI